MDRWVCAHASSASPTGTPGPPAPFRAPGDNPCDPGHAVGPHIPLTRPGPRPGHENDALPKSPPPPSLPTVRLPFHYLGADPTTGPNYTGQPAVGSYYTAS